MDKGYGGELGFIYRGLFSSKSRLPVDLHALGPSLQQEVKLRVISIRLPTV